MVELLLKRRDILQEALNRTELKYQAGQVDNTELNQAQIELLRVESELAETKQLD